MKKVLVLDASQRSALAVTRSLGAHGIDVFCADESDTALAGVSRYCRGYFTYPSARTAPEPFADRIVSLCAELGIDIVLPMTELTTTLLLALEPRIGAALPFPDQATVEQLADKSRLFKLAQEIGVPVPETRYLDQPAPLLDSLDDLPYPLVLKPAKSWLVCGGRWLRSTVRIAHAPEQARAVLQDDPVFSSIHFTAQHFIEGHGQGVFALYDHGQALAFFSHKRLREKPPGGGVSVLSESVDVDPIQLDYAKRLLDAVRWHGIAMVEFRVDARGTPYLMEINTRFWGSLQLAVDAGVDFPYLLYRITTGQPVAPLTTYRSGRRLRWLLGDVDNLYLTLRDPEVARRRKIAAVLAFLRPSAFRTRHEVNRWSDLAPFRLELRDYLRDLRR